MITIVDDLSDHPFKYEILCLGIILMVYLISRLVFMYNLPWAIPLIPVKYYSMFRKRLYGENDSMPDSYIGLT